MQPPREEYYKGTPASMIRTAARMDVELERRKRTDIHKLMGVSRWR